MAVYPGAVPAGRLGPPRSAERRGGCHAVGMLWVAGCVDCEQLTRWDALDVGVERWLFAGEGWVVLWDLTEQWGDEDGVLRPYSWAL